MIMDWREALAALGRLVYFVAAVAVIIGMIVFATNAGAHQADKGWQYPWDCCSDRDCAEISETRVKPVQGGYLIDGKFKVPQAEVRESPDGRYHACFPQPDVLKCFWAPPPGS